MIGLTYQLLYCFGVILNENQTNVYTIKVLLYFVFYQSLSVRLGQIIIRFRKNNSIKIYISS